MTTPIQPLGIIPAIDLMNNVSIQDKPLINTFESMVSEIRKSDRRISDAMLGKVDLHELVTDISMIETNLRILVTVRDSLMGAIQELVRMQI